MKVFLREESNKLAKTQPANYEATVHKWTAANQMMDQIIF